MAEKFYVTSSIPYSNGAPHLGHALEYVQADVVARYQRARERDVLFLTGSDEHGAKIVRSAESAKKSPKEFVDEQTAVFQKLLSNLNISYDDFIRTSDEVRHFPGAQALWKKLEAAGDIYRGRYRGLYCVGHEAFITEKDLDLPTGGGVCRDHKTKPEVIEEENYFFRLSKYVSQMRKAIESGELAILPESRKNEALQMLAEAEDISFSRPSKDISWGVPIPGDATQTMYVWCDALSNYITALGYGSNDQARFEKYWPADIQTIGKDILRFHAVIWPAMLLSAGVALPKKLFVHGFITTKGEKMSKSVGNVEDPFLLIQKYGIEAARFYLLHEIPTFGDFEYSQEHFHDVYNGLLVNGLGNLTSRVLKMSGAFGMIAKPTSEQLEKFSMPEIYQELTMVRGILQSESMTAFTASRVQEAEKRLKECDLSAALRMAWSLFRALDRYIEHYKVYKIIKENPEDARIMLWHVLYALAAGAKFLEPFLPDTSKKILAALGVIGVPQESWTEFHISAIPHLFPKVEK